jgi:hypothetical protein
VHPFQPLPVLLAVLSVPSPPAADVLADADAWVARFERARGPLDEDENLLLQDLVTDLRGHARRGGARRQQAGLRLFDLYGAGLGASRESDPERAAAGQWVRDLCGTEYGRMQSVELRDWAIREVLMVETGNPVWRRAATAHLLSAQRGPALLRALMVAARDPLDALRHAAFEALAGWSDPRVHALMTRALADENEHSAPAMLWTVERHFRQVSLAADDPSLGSVDELVRENLAGASWRRATRGVQLVRCLPDERAVPTLIAALEAWGERAAAGELVRRVEDDLVAELRRRSGRNIGPQPERWRQWWKARQDAPHEDLGGITRAAFFGLRPVSDRVTFVIDRSGSMKQRMQPSRAGSTAPGGWTRYHECVQQMLGFVESLGPRTTFNVVIFSDDATRWRRKLSDASPANLRAAEAWLLRQEPKGGTHLRAGVEEALELERNGELDLDELECDTVIVLCDGATSDGPAWVRPMMERVWPTGRVRFHGVLMGHRGDGSLELLAEQTGGDFVQVDG